MSGKAELRRLLRELAGLRQPVPPATTLWDVLAGLAPVEELPVDVRAALAEAKAAAAGPDPIEARIAEAERLPCGLRLLAETVDPEPSHNGEYQCPNYCETPPRV